MVYVFVFVGEFGYELLNWQGVVRKFAGTIDRDDKIICCSRAGVYPAYEMGHEFVDISAVPAFKQSRASGYDAIYAPALPGTRQLRSYGVWKWLWLRVRSRTLQKRLRIQLQRHVIARSTLLADLNLSGWLKRGIRTADRGRCAFIFSSRTTHAHGCVFGRENARKDIYFNLDVGNNVYRKLEPDLSLRSKIEARLGWSLTDPFVLIQSRQRDASTLQRSTDTIPQSPLIEALSLQIKTVLLAFDTGRWLDSYSTFANHPNCFHYECGAFPEQACLIHFARRCLFFTEGDFGSHIYVPPFLGRDVIAVAPRSVYGIGSAPLEFWNRQVFRFGGQIVPKVAEEVFASTETLNSLLEQILAPRTA